MGQEEADTHREATMLNEATADVAMPIYAVLYERLWRTGERTQHSMSVEAVKPWGAETQFYWRMEIPAEVLSQRIIEIKREN